MAKIAQMPAKDIVDAFRGYLDFYTWCELNIVRSWPRWTLEARTPAVVAAQIPFTYVNQMASTLSAKVIATWQEMAQSGGLTWKDWLNRCYIKGSFSRLTRTPAPPTMISVNYVPLDPPPLVLGIGPINADLPWTVLDLSTYVSANAFAVALQVQWVMSEWGTAGGNWLRFRKFGSTTTFPGYYIQNFAVNWDYKYHHPIIPLDDEQRLQYLLDMTTNAANCYIEIRLLGYFEEL